MVMGIRKRSDSLVYVSNPVYDPTKVRVFDPRGEEMRRVVNPLFRVKPEKFSGPQAEKIHTFASLNPVPSPTAKESRNMNYLLKDFLRLQLNKA